MGAGLDNVNETMTNYGDFHQARYRASEETEGGKDLHGRTKIKTEKGQDDVFQAMGAGLDNMNETVTNLGNFGEETEGGKDLHGKTKIKTEKGQDDVLNAKGARLDNMNETVTNLGDLHQARYRAGDKTKKKTEGVRDLQAETRTAGKERAIEERGM